MTALPSQPEQAKGLRHSSRGHRPRNCMVLESLCPESALQPFILRRNLPFLRLALCALLSWWFKNFPPRLCKALQGFANLCKHFLRILFSRLRFLPPGHRGRRAASVSSAPLWQMPGIASHCQLPGEGASWRSCMKKSALIGEICGWLRKPMEGPGGRVCFPNSHWTSPVNPSKITTQRVEIL